jgi:hypothetical protein
MPKNPIQHEAHRCESCGQTTTYVSKVNKGMATLLGTIAVAIRIKGENRIKLTDLLVDPKTHEWSIAGKRLAEGRITQTQYNNFSHLCRNGLLVNVDVGTFLIPKKGWAFLRGEPIEAAAVIDKKTHSNVGYVADADNVVHMTDIRALFRSQDGWWSGWDYDIGPNGELIHHTQ